MVVRHCILLLLLCNPLLGNFLSENEEKQKRATAGKADVPEPIIRAILDQPANLSCMSPDKRPIRLCRWERLHSKPRHYVSIGELTTNVSTQNIPKNDSSVYTYVGIGFDNGDCTVAITNVTELHANHWECLLIGKDDSTWIGTLEIETYGRISKPYLNTANGSLSIVYDDKNPINTNTNITCCIKGGSPTMVVKFDMQLDRKDNGSDRGFNTTYDYRSIIGNGTQTTCTVKTFYLEPEDNGKSFKCSAQIDNYLQTSVITNSIPVNVQYSPRICCNDSTQTFLDSKTLVVSVKLKSNPEPKMTWLVATTTTNNSEFFTQIGNNSKYSMVLTQVQGDSYNATLTIRDVSEEDSKFAFKVEVVNEFGCSELPVKIVSPNPGEEGTAYWMMLVGVGVLLLMLMIGFAAYLVVSKKKKSGEYAPAVAVYHSEQIEDENG